MALPYSKKVFENFTNPQNMGEIKNASGVGKIGNPTCGDIMWLYLDIEKNPKGQEIIKDIKFKTFGCAAAIATSSMITQLAKGKTLEEAEKICTKDVAESLQGLPPVKMHCSSMSEKALKKAIENYRTRSAKPSESIKKAIDNYRSKKK